MKWRWTVCGRMRTTLVAVAWGALAGCGDAASRSNWTTVRDTLPSGAVRVTNIPAADASLHLDAGRGAPRRLGRW